MQLTFPNGEFANVPLDQGEVTVGSRSSNRVCLPSSGLSALHASFQTDRRGLWLKVPEGVGGVHVNARPVRSLALLRPGDLVCLEQLRLVVLPPPGSVIDEQIPAAEPAALSEQQLVAAARVVLRGASGTHHGRSYTLGASRIVGRAASADIRVEDPEVGDRHAAIELHGDRIVLRSLSPDAYTWVNGYRLRDALLAPGDQLVFGQTRFIVEAPGLPPRGYNSNARLQGSAHTQTLQKVRVPVAADPGPAEPARQEPERDPASLWWLIAAAAVLAASLTALVVYAPRLG